MSDDARTIIAEVLRRAGRTCGNHEPVSGPGECEQCDNSHSKTAAEIDTALGGLTREWITRHESGGGIIRATADMARYDQARYQYRPPGVEDPGSGRLTGIETRWVSRWKAVAVAND